MTTELPAPPIAADADLTGYEYMPLHGDRLRASDTNGRATDAEFRAAVNLWWSAWKQVPASSLPDDDVVLCKLADLGRDIKTWRKVKPVAMANFVKCSDGRLYHRFLAIEAAKAWELRLKARAKGIAGNAKRWGGKQGGEPVDNPPDGDPPRMPDTSPKDRSSDKNGSPGESPKDRKRQDMTGTNPTTAFPVLDASGPESPKAVGENSTPNPEATARVLAECARAKFENTTADDPVIGRWIAEGFTASQVANGIAESARSWKGPGPLTSGYCDNAVRRIVEADRTARRQAEARVRQTAEECERIRKAAETMVEPPSHLMKRYARKAAA